VELLIGCGAIKICLLVSPQIPYVVSSKSLKALSYYSGDNAFDFFFLPITVDNNKF